MTFYSFKRFFSRLDELPEEILVIILQNLSLPALLQSVNRVCKRFNTIIKRNSSLWRYLEFDHQIELDHKALSGLLTREKLQQYRRFCIPEAIFGVTSPEIDLLLFNLHQAKCLLWLDLTGSSISSLGFLINLENLQVLVLDSCPNIYDSDFTAVKHCRNLTHLCIGFTNARPQTIASVLPQQIETLDCSGISFSDEEVYQLLSVHHLQFFTCSLVNEDRLNLAERFPNTTLRFLQS